ncbi:MAG: hypothetical protein KGJ51_12020 [Acidobacteriota bacterium]|nr:hypothetical protein [Acidobacteriota bacterium]MDE3163167.1 hypothetical protein [Acidobacteriota bacterium]
MKRGLAVSPQQYRGSSVSHYTTGMRGVAQIESEWTASLRGPLIAIRPRYAGHTLPNLKAQI